ncbi:hypothetical protein [Micromonospora palythoicola]|uniref:hypothetical protein n=1 Tax=Micromonospora palythoicola TaxID=3120507 RepID=UPI002FCE56C2
MCGTAVGGVPTRLRRWLQVLAASVVAVLAWAGYWWLAVPRFDLCAAVLPAPAGCRSADRIPTATLWTVVVALLHLATVVVALTQPPGRRWPFAAGVTLLAGAAAYGYRAVLYTI